WLTVVPFVPERLASFPLPSSHSHTRSPPAASCAAVWPGADSSGLRRAAGPLLAGDGMGRGIADAQHCAKRSAFLEPDTLASHGGTILNDACRHLSRAAAGCRHADRRP